MRKIVIAALVLAWSGTTSAAECTMARAIYGQPDSKWEVQFKPVPEHSAANMTGAFTVTVPGSGKSLDGEVYQPNGYSQSLGTMTTGCAVDDDDQSDCTYWSGVVYATDASGIVVLPEDETVPAPRQLLFPELGASLWYSAFRDTPPFIDVPFDVFTLKGCSE